MLSVQYFVMNNTVVHYHHLIIHLSNIKVLHKLIQEKEVSLQCDSCKNKN